GRRPLGFQMGNKSAGGAVYIGEQRNGGFMRRLDGRLAVVTGGGNGIGRACCERFAEEGADVVVADVSDDGAHETVVVVESKGRKALFVHTDVSDAAAVD